MLAAALTILTKTYLFNRASSQSAVAYSPRSVSKAGSGLAACRLRGDEPQPVQCAAFFMPGFRLWRPRQESRKARR